MVARLLDFHVFEGSWVSVMFVGQCQAFDLAQIRPSPIHSVICD
jgi:hypothetical protein